jgi:uridine kinase
MRTIVLVAGVSCSGKTTLARRLASEIDAAYISVDDYYRPFSDLPVEERKMVNFDAPDAIEHELLVEHVAQLRAGNTIHKPVYDPASFARMKGAEPIYPTSTVVIEGLFSLYWPELRDQAALRIFVETPLDVCLLRRLKRDIQEYGRTEMEAINRYRSHVHPNQERYVLPTRAASNLIVQGDADLETSLQAVQTWLAVTTA